jgi:argininosuccinate synthase
MVEDSLQLSTGDGNDDVSFDMVYGATSPEFKSAVA